ncbi:unnamed protein product [Menidia menidia]|uniref:Structure-specific endonuclease subunit SLX4 n=1 Tax=Menidia menidia TaxID=238744 RepID=A0A8S4B6H7_9TELE|nr:unnamed protein product [Menidia menidia]
MDDSDQDFAEICSKLLKRVRKKPGETARQSRKAERQTCSQTSDADKRSKNNKQDGNLGSKVASTQPVCAEAVQGVVCAEMGPDASAPSWTAPEDPADKAVRAKDKVLLRMQQFKRASPQKMVHNNKSQSSSPQHQRQDSPLRPSSGPRPEPLDSDEALALRLQQELDREAAEARPVDLEDGGLFFCQICQRDVSNLTPEGRTQHLNRCLDECEQSGLAPPPPSGVPDCPICGMKFKSKGSRSAHLKRCSRDMGVSPAALLQAVQRQAEESAPPTNAPIPTVGTKRKGPTKAGSHTRKRLKKKAEPLDEETMVALALSSSLQEQKMEHQDLREADRGVPTGSEPSQSSTTHQLKWRTDAGAGSRSVSLLSSCAAGPPPPPTPTRSPSALPAWTGAAPLWLKSTLLDGGSAGPSEFYAAELRGFFTPPEPIDGASSSASDVPQPSPQAVGEGAVVTGTRTSILPSCSQAASGPSAPSTPGTGQLPVPSQALRDLMELAEDGMTLTQYGYSSKDKRLSGFIQESEDQSELCASGFLLETTQKASQNTHSQTADQPREERDGGSHLPAALSRLAADMSSMVNNPQLSDVQLQVDSGEVFFAHSFMVYARCPLLAEMVHESGFGVREEGVPAAQRVLLSEVPGGAVLALLQYLYTAQCSIPASLRPHVLELAWRFDLNELEQLCHLHLEEEAAAEGDEEHVMDREQNAGHQTDQAFMELLRSMWNEDDDDDDDDEGGTDSDGGGGEGRPSGADRHDDGVTPGDRDVCEDRVNEAELEEIYEFAATQKKREETDGEEEEGTGEEGGDGDAATRGFGDRNLEPDHSLDRSYSRLFSDGIPEAEDPPPSASPSDPLRTSPSHPRQPRPLHEPSELRGRSLLQSSVSGASDISLCPPAGVSSLPMAGQSPGPEGGLEGAGDQKRDASKRESQGPHSICIPLSPDSPRKSEEPELIVLSDSSEDLEAGVAVPSSHGPAPQSPDPLSYTEIRSRQNQTPEAVGPKGRGSGDLGLSPGVPADCSPEVSWLVPSTPVQAGVSTASSSTQTKSSMRRTQLFPRGHPSPPSSSSSFFFPPSALPLKSQRNVLEKTRHVSEGVEVLATLTRHHSARVSSTLETPPRPYSSSTPLHTEPHSSLLPPAASPLRASAGERSSSSRSKRRASSESSEKTELGSFHLSSMSNSSDPASSSSHAGDGDSKRRGESSGSANSSRTEAKNTGENIETSTNNQATCGVQEQDEADVGESSFRQSFVDEPPIAFNDSWGLDACAEASPGLLSPRWEPGAGSPLPQRGPPSPPPPPEPSTRATPEIDSRLLDSKIWDSWEEEQDQDQDQEEEDVPLSRRIHSAAQLKTPVSFRNKRQQSMVPITPMPHYSDMDTPELKNKLDRFGVRPLPKRQMVLKLKEIHQYTHQLASSGSEDEEPGHRGAAPAFKEPAAPAGFSPAKDSREEEAEQLSASQSSNASSTISSGESERTNPERPASSDGESDSDGGVSCSQAGQRLQERLQAVRSFILSDSRLYGQILQFRPLVLSQLQAQLRAAGVRLGAARLVDYLDSQCITFTTARPGQPPPGRSRRQRGARAGGGGGGGGGRKKAGSTAS